MNEEVKIKDRFVANEIKRRELIRTNQKLKEIEGTEQGLESDINAKNIALLTVLFVPAVYPILESILGGELAGYVVKEGVKLIAPLHTNLQETADIIGNIIGAFAGDPAAREIIAEKLGKQGIEQIQLAFPNILNTVEARAGKLSFELPTEAQEAISSIPMKQLELFKEKIEKIPQQLVLFKQGITLGKKETAAKIEKLEDTYHRTGSIVTAMYDAQLSNPRISLTKLITDQLFLPVQIAFRSLGVAAEHGMTAGAKNAAAAVYAYKESFKEALKYAAVSFKEGRPAFQEMLGYGREQVFGVEKFNESPVAHGWRWVAAMGSNSVMAADQLAKAIAYRANKRMAAYILALEEAEENGLVAAAKIHFADLRAEDLLNGHGAKDTLNAIEERAKLKMFEDTFTDQSKLVKALGGVLNQVPGLRLLVPYLRTPAALIKQGYYISPLAPLTSSFRNDLLNSIEPWKRVDESTALAKWTVGTALYSWLADETAKGNIVGSGPGGELKDVWMHKKHPQSIKIGDEYYGYRHLGPFAQILSMSADSAEMFSHSEDNFSQQELTNNIGQMLAEKSEDIPFLQSVSNIMHAIDSFKEGGTAKAAEEWIGQEASGFIPAPVRIAAHIEDPVLRKATNAFETIKENIPGWSKTVPARRDRFGYLQIPPVGSGHADSATKVDRLLNNISPVPLEGDTVLDPVDKELYKHGIKFNPIPDHLGDKDVSVAITPEQRSEWEINAGHGIKINNMNQHELMTHIINSDIYQKSPPNIQKQQLEGISTAFRSFGKQQLLQKYPRIQIEIMKTHQEMMEQNPSGSK